MLPTSIAMDGATWWWAAGPTATPRSYADFACDLDLAADPGHAWIAISCGSWYTLWIDGVWIAHGPPREVAPWQYYDVVDLQPLLHAGRNRLRIRAWHIGGATQYHEPCLAGILVRGLVDDQRLDERQRWRAAVCQSQLSDPPHLHNCVGWGEHADLAIDPQAWLHADADPAWALPAVVGRHPLPGRERLMPSDLPPGTGRTWQAAPLHERDGWQVWDFGREVFGFLTADLECPEPRTCDLLQGESLDRRGLPDFRFGGGDFRDRLELPAQRRSWTSFEKRALRYLALPTGVAVHRLAVREHHRPLLEVWRRRDGIDPQDHAIIAAAARTVTLCSDDLLNDCPRRERAQYNDPSVYMRAFPLLFGTTEPVRRWLRQYLRGAGPDGVLRMCYPSPPTTTAIPDFSISFARALTNYLDLSGDLETVHLGFPSAVAAVEAYRGHAGADGLLRDVPGWTFLCNSFELARFPRSAGLNALWASSFAHLAALGRVLGDHRADGWAAEADQLRRAWRTAFWRDGRILDADSSPDHDRIAWWNWHADADPTVDPPSADAPIAIEFTWCNPGRTLFVAAHARIRVAIDGLQVLDAGPDRPWFRPAVFEPHAITLPEGRPEVVIAIELQSSPIDREIYIASDTGSPAPLRIGSHTTRLRPWSAPRWNQITAGYAIDAGMLEDAEAVELLHRCLRSDYHVPWLKRTTPIICKPTDDRALIADRAVLCNTPQSLAFFCSALRRHGLRTEAADLCRRLFGAMIEAGSTTLWEEFAPRSSLCHAWSAMCVEHLLDEAGPAR